MFKTALQLKVVAALVPQLPKSVGPSPIFQGKFLKMTLQLKVVAALDFFRRPRWTYHSCILNRE